MADPSTSSPNDVTIEATGPGLASVGALGSVESAASAPGQSASPPSDLRRQDILDLLDDKTIVRSLAPTQASAAGFKSTAGGGATGGSPRRRFGEYELVRELARGGMGVVYEAKQPGLGRTVAVKMILAGEFASEDQVLRFFAEARSVANLDHPNIVPVFEVGEHNGLHFFSMKLVEGGSLTSRLAEYQGNYPRIASLVEKVSRAVHHAHQRGVLHRDLKPGNILLDKAGEPMVTDFGLAKVVSDDSNITRSDAIVGTPAYMAPEQARGAGFATTATDTWALGAILYHMLVGAPPFKGATPVDTLRLLQDTEPSSPRSRIPGIPRDLETIALKCLHKDQNRRYPSAEALADDLKRFQSGEPVYARPVSRPERIWRWCRRNPGLAITGTVALVALLAAIVILSVAVVLIEKKREEASTLALRNAKLAETEQGLRQTEQTLRQEAQREAVRGAFREAWSASATGSVPANDDPAIGLLMLAATLEDAERVGATDVAEAARLQIAAWQQVLCPLVGAIATPQPDGVTPLVALSQTGELGAVCGGTRVRLFDTNRFGAIGSEITLPSPARCMAYQPRTHLLFLGLEDGSGRWIDPSGKLLPTISVRHPSEIRSCAFDQTGERLLIGTNEGSVHILDTQEAPRQVDTPARDAPLMQAKITAVAWNHGGTAFVASGDSDMFAIVTPGEKPEYDGPFQVKGPILHLAFSPDDQSIEIATASNLERYSSSGKRLDPVPLNGAVRAAFAPGGGSLLVAGNGSQARVMDLMASAIPAILRHDNLVQSVAWSGDGRSMITWSSEGVARVWRTRATDPVVFGLPSQIETPDPILVATTNSSVRLYATGTEKGKIRVFKSGERLPVFEAFQKGRIDSIALSPDGRYALTGSNDTSARLWDMKTGKLTRQPVQMDDWVTGVEFSPIGDLIFAMSTRGQLRILHTSDLTDARPVIRHSGGLAAACFSPDGKSIALAGLDGLIRVLPAKLVPGMTQEVPIEIVADTTGVWSIAFSPDGRRLAVAGKERKAKVWDLATRQPMLADLAHGDEVLLIAFSPDGSRLATGSRDKRMKLWDAKTGLQIGEAVSLPDYLSALAFSPDGRFVAAGAGDGSAVVCDARMARPIGPPIHASKTISALLWQADSAAVLVASQDGTLTRRAVESAKGSPNEIAQKLNSITGLKREPGGTFRVVTP